MKKGGYQILDLKNTSFTVGSSVEISGAYETIEGTDKAILVSGLVVGGKQYDDVFAEVDTNNSNYIINVYDYTLTIMANDMVVVSLQQDNGGDYVEVEYKQVGVEGSNLTPKEGYIYYIFSDKLELFISQPSTYEKVNYIICYQMNNELYVVPNLRYIPGTKLISFRATENTNVVIIKQKMKEI